MSNPYPFILASEFIEHAFIIVLAGIVLVEFFTRPKTRGTLAILVLVFLMAAWLLSEFFAHLDETHYHFMVHWPVLLFSLGILVFLSNFYAHILPRTLFFSLILILITHLAIDMLALITHVEWLDVVRVVTKLTEAFLLYFFVLSLIIRIEHDAR